MISLRAWSFTLTLTSSTAAISASLPPASTELPIGGQVVAGQAAIAQSGSALRITQGSQRAAIDWQSFNVGAQAQVNFVQPSASSVTLNRVLDANPSQIFGRISANGQVFLTNPNGVYFAPGASVDVGGLVATTHSIGNADFMAGNDLLTRNGANGGIINEGSLNSSLGGYIALLAPEVRNNGVIVAQLGTVALAAGEAYTLQFDANTTLANIQVSPASISALVENRNAVLAPGGLIILSAQAASTLQGAVVRTSGILEAKGLSAKGGRIFLDSGVGGQTLISGILDVSSTSGKGGRIEVTGERVLIDEGGYLTASGKTGGGEVLVGGSWQNSEPTVRQAISTTVAPFAQLEANATDRGNGGSVVVWSDIHHPDSVTRAYGSFEARGGPNGGDGGRIETSGRWLDTQGARGSAAAPQGNAGLWLFDPYDITITSASANGSFTAGTYTPSGNSSTILNTTINTLLSAGTDVTISTGGTGSAGAQGGDITVTSAITKSAGATATLKLQAARNINVNANITSSSGALNITLSAANTTAAASSTAGTLGGVDVNADLASNGGAILIGGGAGSTTNGIGYALNRSASLSAVTIEANKSITSSGGNITINGKSLRGSSSGNYGGVDGGVYILSGATLLSGTGNLNIFGESSAGSKTFGIAVEANSNTITTIGTSSTSGNLLVNGVNTTTGVTDTDRANGALGLVNNGSISRLLLLGSSVANTSVQVNSSTKLIVYTPGTGCVAGYTYCGSLAVPGGNNSYLYAGYSVNTAATLPITVETGDSSKTYQGSASATGLSYVVTGAPSGYSTSTLSFLTSSANVGTYGLLDNNNPTTYVSGATTYAVAYYKGNYSITAKALTASAIAASREYDGTTTASPTLTITGGLVGSETVTATGAATFNSKNVGSRTATINSVALSDGNNGGLASNYSLSNGQTTAANITAKALTVTAKNVSKTYDGLAYSGGNGVNYSGFVSDENPSVLVGSLAYDGSSQGAMAAGYYAITPSGYSSENYVLNYVNGSLTVNPAPPPSLYSQSYAPQASQSTPPVKTALGGSGIVVSLVREPMAIVSGLVFVAVPKDTVVRGEGFNFPLPAKIAETITGQVQITTLEGAPLPSWLKYSPDTKSFTASAVPNAALPMQVMLINGEQQTIILISE